MSAELYACPICGQQFSDVKKLPECRNQDAQILDWMNELVGKRGRLFVYDGTEAERIFVIQTVADFRFEETTQRYQYTVTGVLPKSKTPQKKLEITVSFQFFGKGIKAIRDFSSGRVVLAGNRKLSDGTEKDIYIAQV